MGFILVDSDFQKPLDSTANTYLTPTLLGLKVIQGSIIFIIRVPVKSVPEICRYWAVAFKYPIGGLPFDLNNISNSVRMFLALYSF